MQALIDELEFNRVVAAKTQLTELGCPFRDAQFDRAVSEGAIAILLPDIKGAILQAYELMGAANQVVDSYFHADRTHSRATSGSSDPIARVKVCAPAIERALAVLLTSLGRET